MVISNDVTAANHMPDINLATSPVPGSLLQLIRLCPTAAHNEAARCKRRVADGVN